MDEENAVCVALLHDVIEDHGDKYTFEKLKEEGFNEEIITALKPLTNDKAVPYMDYVKEIGKNELASKVKIADLKHNSDALGLNGNASKKYGLYKQALEYLTSL